MSHTEDQVNPKTQVVAELDHLLDTVVGRKTNQGLILGYLGQLYLRGEESAKEHAIAVDALGRGSDFDPKREAIVRVEVHKLRRVLKTYYSGPGQDRPIHIALGLGKYAIVIEGADQIPAPPATPPEPVIAPPPPSPRLNYLVWTLLAAAVGVGVYFSLGATEQPSHATTERQSTAPATPRNTFRILAGAADRRYVDSAGQEWLGDRFFTGGRAVVNQSVHIQNSPDQVLYKGLREGDFFYEIPLDPGDYEIRIHFAETTYGKDNLGGGGEASRLFQVLINSVVALSHFDVILAAGGPNMALVRVFPGQHPGPDGKLRIRFESDSNDKAFVNAIEIVPGLKDRMLPFRIAAGAPHIAVDTAGTIWLPDRYVSGGRAVERLKPVQADIPELFRFERYGRFEYNLPAVPGHQFQVKLWMAEQYFGVYTTAGTQPRRVFDLFSNGTTLLRDFSILDAAGGPAKAVQKTFTNLTPDAQGNIRLLFSPSVNYAALNAIELIDLGPSTRFR